MKRKTRRENRVEKVFGNVKQINKFPQATKKVECKNIGGGKWWS
jgi:hypothetical protein